MRTRFYFVFIALVLLFSIAGCSSCQRQQSNAFVITLSDKVSSVDPNLKSEAANERIRVLIFNSLVKKNEKFDYVPDLAKEIKRADDGLSYTFTLHDNVKFHNGQLLTSADVKYTFDTLLASTTSDKAPSFFEDKKPYVTVIETPDAKTVVFRLRKPWLNLLTNLVPIAIIPQGTADRQKDSPIGSGPFKFVRKEGDTLVELVRNPDYWEGAPKIETLIARVVGDANALQAELKSGKTTLAPLPSNLTPDALNTLAQDSNLKVEQFPGANVVYLGFNTQSAPFNNVKVRQAIAYAIDRESIVKDLLKGQAKVAHSIIPEESWAYSANVKYNYDPAKAKQLLDEAGFKDPDNDGPQMRFSNEMAFKISAGNIATSQFAQVIQQSLKQIGVPVRIETLETGTLIEQLKKGQFQMTTLRWVGGNQDPIFLRDIFESSESTDKKPNGRNRGRYINPEFDKIISEAVETADRQKAQTLYAQAQDIVARDVPMLPLWYPANMVVAQKYVGNIKVDGSGDWSFVKNLTVEKKQ
jgi:peptide/nickel transport system substrate-binding protein